jgi:hypothetical protein
MAQDAAVLKNQIEELQILVETQRRKLEQAEKEKKFYFDSLDHLVFLCSHKVRQPVSQILGLSTILHSAQTPDEILSLIKLVTKSAASLDNSTREFTVLIHNLKVIYSPE